MCSNPSHACDQLKVCYILVCGCMRVASLVVTCIVVNQKRRILSKYMACFQHVNVQWIMSLMSKMMSK